MGTGIHCDKGAVLLNRIRHDFLVGMGMGFLCMGFFGCSGVELSKVPKKPLPPSPPSLTELRIELPPEGGPRRPADLSPSSTLINEVPSIVIIEKDPTALRTAAEQDASVKPHLGEGFGYIDTEEVYADQCKVPIPEEGSLPPRPTHRPRSQEVVHRLTYYSYTHNTAVYVCLKGNQVTSVLRDPRQGYQPEEGEEEVEHAIALAQKDSRIAQDVQNLVGHAILTSPEEYRYLWVGDEAGFGHRVFWVTFSETPESLALFFARVDLTEDTVLDAGKEPGPQ